MSFEWPLALVALLAVPLLLAVYVRYERRRLTAAARFTNPGLLPNLVDSSSVDVGGSDPVTAYHRRAAPCARIKHLVTCRSQ